MLGDAVHLPHGLAGGNTCGEGDAACWVEATRELCSLQGLRWTFRPAEEEQNGRWGVGHLVLRVCVYGTVEPSFMFRWWKTWMEMGKGA